ncbi:hypothetical protein HDU98_009871 [Podochytrium sp. JEL0797]|nr:hypothetical protein HDU98_009871 [Podochytrium sp. JEL0797]
MDIPLTDFSALTDLFQAGFKAEQDRSGSQNVNPSASAPGVVQKMTPGAIGHTSKASPAAESTTTRKTAQEIWDVDEVQDTLIDEHDPRPQPEFTTKFRQNVSSEDMYLQMSGKTPSFGHCDAIVVEIQLPGTEYKQIELTVTEKVKLVFHFPRDVKDCEGTAKWEKDRGVLVVSAVVRLRKEFNHLQKEPVPFIQAKPLESNILEWHYLLEGPADSPYAGGFYWGKLVFPADYPFAPPGIQMITPSGRFQPSTRLCLSMSDYHPESWCPGWNVGTILNGLLSFMLEDTITTGSIRTTAEEKVRLAKESMAWNKTNAKFVELFPDA